MGGAKSMPDSPFSLRASVAPLFPMSTLLRACKAHNACILVTLYHGSIRRAHVPFDIPLPFEDADDDGDGGSVGVDDQVYTSLGDMTQSA